MREIKFRAWTEPENKMLSWNNLLNMNLHNALTIPEQCGLILMQYTGLHDKNGKEIYEGDIVAEKGHYFNSDRLVYQKIQWKEKYSCWLKGEYQRLTPKNIKTYQIEVVGNIYDNPDLLEREEKDEQS